MKNKDLLTLIKNGHPFFIQYGKTSFSGTLSEFSTTCKNFVDYSHKPYNYFGFAVIVGGREYELNTGWKPVLFSVLN